MAQKGFVFANGTSWFLKYRDNFLVDGVIIRKQKVIFLAKKSDRYRRPGDLDDLVVEKLAGVRAADRCPRASESFVNYVENTWLPFVQRSKKPSTYAGYRSYWLRYLKPRVGKYALRDFTVAVVSSLLEDITSMHQLNIDTVGKVRSILSAVFTYAMGKGNYPGKSAADNPASCALIPEAATEPKETVAASRDEVRAILAALDAKELMLERAAVALVAFTGVRPGECRGLRWEEWNRSAAEIKVVRSVWHAIEGTTKTKQSNRFVAVTPELRTILTALWNAQGCPISGYILAREDGGWVNLDNMSKRTIAPALKKAGIEWHGYYSVRRFHGTQVREGSNLETTAKALGNSKAVADRHYVKPKSVLPDVRKAVNDALSGLVQ